MAERHLAMAQGMRAQAGRVHPLRGNRWWWLGGRRDSRAKGLLDSGAITPGGFDPAQGEGTGLDGRGTGRLSPAGP